MLELLAVIVTADPPALLVWLVLAVAAGMYPVGLMLGSSCSPCCPAACGTPPYIRCLREECLTCSPRRGTSTRISSMAAAGTASVCARHVFSVTARGTTFRTLSKGESVVITATQFPGVDPALGSSAQTQPAGIRLASGEGDLVPGVFTITAEGVDTPLNVSTDVGNLNFGATESGQSRSASFTFGNQGTSRFSVNAPVSVHMREVVVTSGGEYLDPADATEQALLSMVSWSQASYVSGDAFQATWTISPSANIFRYLPAGVDCTMTLTVEFRRGESSVFRFANAVIRKTTGQAVDPLPPGGLPPLSLPDRELTDTPNTQTQPQAGDRSLTVWSNSSILGRTADYAFEPTGLSVFFQPAQVVTPSQQSSNVGRTISCGTSRRVFDPTNAQGRVVSFPNAPYNLNYDQVDEYLAGTRCLQYATQGQTYERCVEPSNVLCGLTLCDRMFLLPQTVTLSAPSPCGGSIPVVGRLGAGVTGGTGNCRYYGAMIYCDAAAIIREQSGGASGIPPSRFFDGDLLYSLQKGPSRSSVTVSGIGTITLGGSPTLPQGGVTAFSWCGVNAGLNGLADIAGKCPSGVSIGASSITRGAVIPSLTSGNPGQEVLDMAQGFADEACAESHAGSLTSNIFVGCGSRSASLSSGPLTDRRNYTAGVSYAPCTSERSTSVTIGRTKRFSAATQGGQQWTFEVVLSVSRASSQSDSVSGNVRVSMQPAVGFNSGSIGWQATGTVSVGDTNGTPSAVAARITSITPSSRPWQGGGYSVTNVNFDNTGGTFTGTLAARTDGIQTDAGVIIQTGNFSNAYTDGPSAISTMTQGFKPCGIVGLTVSWGGGSFLSAVSYTAPSAGISGLFVPTFEMDTPCETEYTATPTAPWISVRRNADLRTICVDIQPNGTGSQRSAAVQLSPVWLLNGLPSTSSSATSGTLTYAITQQA